MIFLTCFLKTKAQYVTRTTFLIMDFPALFLVILAIYLYGIRPHSYIYTFKSKGSRSRKSYFALFPSLHFHRQVQFIVIATTSGAAARKEIVFGAKSICRKTDILRNCDAWVEEKHEKNVKYSIVSLPPPSFHFLQAFVPRRVFSSKFYSTCISRGKNVINTR